MRNAERDAQIVRAYAVLTAAEVARAFGLSTARVRMILHCSGFRLGEDERRRRSALGLSTIRYDPEIEARRRAAVSAAKLTWPDCPPEIRPEYEWLIYMKKVRSCEARAMLEAV
jgi:hypothetical protein